MISYKALVPKTNNFLNNTINLILNSSGGRCKNCGSILKEYVFITYNFFPIYYAEIIPYSKNSPITAGYFISNKSTPKTLYFRHRPESRKMVKARYATKEKFEKLIFSLYCYKCASKDIVWEPTKDRFIIKFTNGGIAKAVGLNPKKLSIQH